MRSSHVKLIFYLFYKCNALIELDIAVIYQIKLDIFTKNEGKN